MTDVVADPRMTGFKELQDAISALADSQSGKVLRGATMSASLPVVNEAKKKIPVGTRAHKTYRGRLVAPGFAKRQGIKRKSRLVAGGTKAIVWIGPPKEAFYTTQWLDPGMKSTTYSRKSKSGKTTQVTRTRSNYDHRHWLRDSLKYKQDDVITRWSNQAIKRLEKIAAQGYGRTRGKKPK